MFLPCWILLYSVQGFGRLEPIPANCRGRHAQISGESLSSPITLKHTERTCKLHTGPQDVDLRLLSLREEITNHMCMCIYVHTCSLLLYKYWHQYLFPYLCFSCYNKQLLSICLILCSGFVC